MEFRKAIEEDIVILTEISTAAFSTDVSVGGEENDGPPGYDSYQWHKNMMTENHLFTYTKHNEIVGGAVLFKEKSNLYIGRIFISPEFFRQGYGQLLMQKIEDYFPDINKINLDTPIWNTRTNNFYHKCGYTEIGKDQESVYYEKRLVI